MTTVNGAKAPLSLIIKNLPDASISPEGLLLFCQSQLGDLDQKIREGMTKQKQMVGLQNLVASAKAGLVDIGLIGTKIVEHMDETKVAALDKILDQAWLDARALGDTDAMAALASVKNTLHLDGNLKAGDTETKAMNDLLDTAVGSARSGAELQMIELQGFMSKRATALQLTTNMLNSLNEGSKSIAGNIGR
jgi:hypothetical protein